MKVRRWMKLDELRKVMGLAPRGPRRMRMRKSKRIQWARCAYCGRGGRIGVDMIRPGRDWRPTRDAAGNVLLAPPDKPFRAGQGACLMHDVVEVVVGEQGSKSGDR